MGGLNFNGRNFYPRSPCGERRWTLQNHQDTSPISIHALLAESDVSFMLYDTSSLIFLSTLSLRRATRKAVTTRGNYRYFYPRSPCGERHLRVVDGSKSSIISIHALLAESDGGFALAHLFQLSISIHALLAESDRNFAGNAAAIGISIHALLAESDLLTVVPNGQYKISIHALLAESDRQRKEDYKAPVNFYPRSPCGERPPDDTDNATGKQISIHALLAESDSKSAQNNGALLHI